MQKLLAYDDLVYAYSRAIQGKSKRKDIQLRQAELETNMHRLYTEIISGTYRIGRTRRYIVRDPVIREIVVIPFRDRIIQHLVSHYLTPLFEPQRIHDSYANRVGKGTLFGIRRVDHFLRSCSQQYTRDCRILKLDIQSCFMSIRRQQVWELITRRLFACQVSWCKPLVLALLREILFHDYVTGRQDCTIADDRAKLPSRKSMLMCPSGCGLPLGNLTSHLFANIILHELDMFIKHELKMKYYGRYVDDFVCMHTDHAYVKSCIHRIDNFLYQHLGLTLHPAKIYLQHYVKGVLFLGIVIKPFCRMIGRRTLIAAQRVFRSASVDHGVDVGHHLMQQCNSYLGLMRQHSSFSARKSLVHALPSFRFNELRSRPAYVSVKARRRVVEDAQISS